MDALAEALDRREQELLLLRLSTIAFLKSRAGYRAPMGDVLAHLQKLTRSDANISRAVSFLQSYKQIRLDGVRDFVLTREEL